MTTKVYKVLQKEAISVVPTPCTRGFLSRIFLVPKQDGSQRPVINLRQLNQFVVWKHFNMENIHLEENLIQEGDWMIKMDLKDAYFFILIHQFQCLPFGLSSAPWVFTKVTQPIVAWLRQLGIRMVAYIDDFLLLAHTKEEAYLQAQ